MDGGFAQLTIVRLDHTKAPEQQTVAMLEHIGTAAAIIKPAEYIGGAA